MAGVIINNKPDSVLMQAVQALAGGAINDMFARTSEARALKNAQALKDQETEAERLKKQQEYEQQTAYRQAQVDALGNLSPFNRNDPTGMFKNMGIMEAFGLGDVNSQFQHVFPQLDTSNINLGSQNVETTRDPMSGSVINQAVRDYTESPDARLAARTSDTISRRSTGLGYARLNSEERRAAQQNDIEDNIPMMIRAYDVLSKSNTDENGWPLPVTPESPLGVLRSAIYEKLGSMGEVTPEEDTSVAGQSNTQDFNDDRPEPIINQLSPDDVQFLLSQGKTLEDIQAEGYKLPPLPSMGATGGSQWGGINW